MSRSFPPHAGPSQWFPHGSGAWGSWATAFASTNSQHSALAATSTTTVTPTSPPPETSPTGVPLPSTSLGSDSALTGTAHHNVKLKIIIPVCLVAVALAMILAIIWFGWIRKRSPSSSESESVHPYPLDMEPEVVGSGTHKGGRGFVAAGTSKFRIPSAHRPESTAGTPSEREQQLENQLTTVMQKLEALEAAMQPPTAAVTPQGHWDEQPPDYMVAQSTTVPIEVEADRKAGPS